MGTVARGEELMYVEDPHFRGISVRGASDAGYDSRVPDQGVAGGNGSTTGARTRAVIR